MNSIPWYIYLALFLMLWLLIEAIIKVVLLTIARNNITSISIGNISIFNFKLYKTQINIGLLPFENKISYKAIVFKTYVKKAFENILINLILIILLFIISASLMGVDLWIDSMSSILNTFANIMSSSGESTVISLKEYSTLEMVGFLILVMLLFNLVPIKETYLGSILNSIGTDLIKKEYLLSSIQFIFFGFLIIFFLINYLKNTNTYDSYTSVTEDAPTVTIVEDALIELYKSSDYNRSIQIIEPLAIKDNVEAQAWLGFIYNMRNDDFKLNEINDKNNSIKWYKKAAINGDEKSMIILGDMYSEGNGVYKDYKEAFKWYKKAALLGNEDAKVMIEASK